MVKRTTIKDVARQAGTSYQTVSRVINNRPDVAPETRKRVRQAIEELHYRPSMAATTRANPRTYILALAISPYNEFLLYEGDPHLLRVIHGIDDELAVRNYSLLLSTIHFNSDGQIQSRLLNRQLADGVIIRLSMYDHGQTAKHLADRGYPVVVIGYSQHPEIPAIRSDDVHGGYTQTQHLLALGHRRIGVISGPEADPATAMRVQGHQRAMVSAGFDTADVPIVVGDYTAGSGYQAAAELLQSTPDLTAIAAFSDTMAIGAMQWLHEHGYSIPGDCSIVGYDDVPAAQRQAVQLTTIRIPSMEEGRRAAQILFDLTANRELSVTKTVLPVHLVTRQSTGNPNG